MTDYKLRNLVATDAIWDAAGDFAVGTGANTAAKKTTTEVSALLVDVVQAADLSIADNDTLALTFDFVPSKIIISYSLREAHITSFEEGFAVGHCVVTITGTDTFTSVLNYADFYDKNGAFGATYGNGDTTNIVQGYGGYNGANYGQLDGTGAWVTSTKTLTITFQETNTDPTYSFLELVATAYP